MYSFVLLCLGFTPRPRERNGGNKERLKCVEIECTVVWNFMFIVVLGNVSFLIATFFLGGDRLDLEGKKRGFYVSVQCRSVGKIREGQMKAAAKNKSHGKGMLLGYGILRRVEKFYLRSTDVKKWSRRNEFVILLFN